MVSIWLPETSCIVTVGVFERWTANRRRLNRCSGCLRSQKTTAKKSCCQPLRRGGGQSRLSRYGISSSSIIIIHQPHPRTTGTTSFRHKHAGLNQYIQISTCIYIAVNPLNNVIVISIHSILVSFIIQAQKEVSKVPVHIQHHTGSRRRVSQVCTQPSDGELPRVSFHSSVPFREGDDDIKVSTPSKHKRQDPELGRVVSFTIYKDDDNRSRRGSREEKGS